MKNTKRNTKAAIPGIERLSWTRIAKIWNASKPTSAARKSIVAECRRLGYTPRTILGLHS